MKKKPGKAKVWATWNERCGFFDVHLTKSDAVHSLESPNSGYDTFNHAKHDGWRIVRCEIRPLSISGP